jgi:UDP:flavonoid glycosyltransferase YjiC (YdhE family)
MVVAGATEDKKEVAARVAWSGTGINLRTGRPSARALRRAVQRILQDPQFSLRAGTLRQRTDELGDPVEAILQSLTSLVSRAIDADQSSAGSGSGHRPRNCQS